MHVHVLQMTIFLLLIQGIISSGCACITNYNFLLLIQGVHVLQMAIFYY